MKIQKVFYSISFGLLAWCFVGGLAPAISAERCSFARDLEVGNQGEDIRCLQKYLNSAGFAVASSGIGSPGQETSLFREQTAQAVQAWQKANGLSSSGFFGPLSREKYNTLVSASASTATTAPTALAALQAKLATLTDQLNQAKAVKTPVVTDTDTKTLILNALSEIADAEDQIDDAKDDGKNTDVAQGGVDDAKDDLFDAIRAYFSGDLTKAHKYADNAIGNAQDAFEDAGGESRDDKLSKRIDDLRDDLEKAQTKIDEADDSGKNVDNAQDILDQAEDKLDQADDKLDDEELDAAGKLADDAENLIDDSTDAIGDVSKADAKSAISAAKSDISNTQDQVDDADNDDEDVSEAEDLLTEARNFLKRAENYYDDADYDNAKKMARSARDRANDALDSL